MGGITFNRNPRSLEEACKKKTREGIEIGKEGTESGVEGKSRTDHNRATDTLSCA